MPKLSFWKMEGEPTAPGSSAAPASAPAAATVAGGEQDVNWEGLSDDSLDETSDEGVKGDPPAKPAAEPITPATPAAPAAPAAPAPAPAAPPAQPAAPAPTQEQLEQQQREQRERMLAEAETVYAAEMSEEVQASLIAEPHKVLPKLLAQAVLDGANLAVAHMRAQMPQLIGQVTQARTTADKALTEFTAANPDLAGENLRSAVASAVKTVKESGQKFASKEEAMARVAQVARALAGLPQPGTAPAAPSEPMAPPAPHTPVARGRAASAPASPPKGGIWSELAEVDDED